MPTPLGDTGAPPRIEDLRLALAAARALIRGDALEVSVRELLRELCREGKCSQAHCWSQDTGGRLERIASWPPEVEAPAELVSAAALQAMTEGAPARSTSAGGGRRCLAIPLRWRQQVLGAMVLLDAREPVLPDQGLEWVCADLGEWLGRKRDSDHASAEERYRLLVEHLGEAVILLDTAGRVASWPPAAQRVLGYRPEEVVGKSVALFYLNDPSPQRALEVELDEAQRAGRFEVDDWRVRADGTSLWAHIVTCPIRNRAGRLIGYAKIVRDLTSVRDAELARELHQRALERSNRELEGFASIASHDLQEPLRKILAFGSRLRSSLGPHLDEKSDEYLRKLEGATQRMQSLIDGLLAYSRLGGRADPLRDVDLNVIVAEVLRDLDSHIENIGAVVSIGRLPTVEANPTQMRQLFTNLISNGLKSRRQKVTPKITVSATPKGSAHWELRVEDNGIGFDERHAERIFGMLQRLHGRGEYEGTGMGLAICRKIAERHGGTISARSTPGAGSSFILNLPAKAQDSGG